MPSNHPQFPLASNPSTDPQKGDRIDPEVILARVQSEEAKQKRGRLKVFFGACPGVGKTYSMLEEAHARRHAGEDLVAGLVETHGRAETQALLEGIEIIPRREIAYRGVTLREFDLDTALKRKPALLLLDELAHTNAPGSRHAGRWQDVRELLAAGIDVYTTLNVQHIESLNDVVAQITGIVQRETVPDSILEDADEIVLIDLPPEELLDRLAKGKVYRAEQAAQATEKFFRKSNLSALRELALRFLANRINVQVQFARRDQTVSQIWPTTERLLVCVGPSPSSARLIRATRRMAGMLHAEWIALTVEIGSTLASDPRTRERLLENQRLAELLGGEVVTLTGERVATLVIDYARSRNVTKIIVGKPVLPWWRERLLNSLVDQIVRLSGDIDIYVIRGEGDLQSNPSAEIAPAQTIDRGGYLYALLVVAMATGVAWLIYPYLDLTNLVMVYLLGVLVTAMRGRPGPAAFASVLSVILFDVLFVSPRFSLAVSDVSYLFTLTVMLCVALMISTLTLRLRRQADTASNNAREIAAQNNFNRKLASTRGVENLIRLAIKEIGNLTGEGVWVFLPDSSGSVVARDSANHDLNMEQLVAQWVYENGKPAGRGTDTLNSTTESLVLPLRAADLTIGALCINLEQDLTPSTIRLLDGIAGVIGLALEVERLDQQRIAVQLQMETERMQSSILSSVSHDLRTPLATIMGSAGSLIESGEQIDASTRVELLQDIHHEAERLSRLINNLMEMMRLQGGALQLKREPQPLEEIVGMALSTIAKKIGKREIEIEIPEDLPPADVDGILIQHVLMNLIENALNYSPSDQPIRIEARQTGEQLIVQILDRGPGIPVEEKVKVFEKFFRGKTANPTAGSGLGLAISKGIIEAHGSTIKLQDRVGGGSVFSFTLPVSDLRLPEE